jgi:hypothetical protein
MDFDHTGDKVANIAVLIRKPVSRKKLDAEIVKCEIVCACCHRLRTQARLLELADRTGSNPVALTSV